MNILVSACLLGLSCRYCGDGNYHQTIDHLKEEHHIIPVCPEQLGGLPTPRASVEILQGRAINCNGEDVTEQFEKGAEEVLKIAKMFDCKKAILKSKSPSCGFGIIYDGTFSKTKISGNGFTAQCLSDHGIKVCSEMDFET